MPNTLRILSPFIPGTGNPDTAYETASGIPGSYQPYQPGDLGNIFEWGVNTYRKVVMDPAAQVAAPGQVLFWKDRANFVVTNVAANALLNGVATSNRNNVAGICRSAVPAGAQFFMLIAGRNIPVLEAGAGAGGMILIANTGANADALGVAIGTSPAQQTIGTVATNFAGGKVTANVNITQ